MNKRKHAVLFVVFLLAMVFVYSATAANRLSRPDKSGHVGKFTSLVLDENGFPVISYHQESKNIDSYPGPGGTELTEHDLKIMHCNDPNCRGDDESITTPDMEGDVGTHTSLALDKFGYPVVSYFDHGSGALKLMRCNDPNCYGGDESIRVVDARRGAGKWSSLALDSKGYPVVAYEAGGFLRVMHCNDRRCAGGDESFGTPDLDGGEFNSLQLNGDGNPVISYRGAAGKRMKVMHCNDPVCIGRVETITFPGIDRTCADTSMALDAAGNPVVGFIWNDRLFVMHCNDSSCQGGDESIKGPYLSPLGSNLSLALDANGNPVISAWILDAPDSTRGRLGVLRCNDPNCDGIGERMTTPDTEGNSGQYSSLVIDRRGNPAISYYAGDLADLKLLRCDTPTCAPAIEPQAMFNTTPLEGKPPRTARFTQQSTGDFDECLWNFGDGSTAVGCGDQSHVYEKSGLFTVSLTVSGWAGSDEYRCRGCINIFEPSTADFSVSPSSGLPPLFVKFRNLSTGDFDTCLWDFGDGHGSHECTGVTHVYSDLGNYRVRLTVNGDGGRAAKIMKNAVYVHKEPVADFAALPTSGHPPLKVEFQDQSTGEYDKCTWDFGDGKPTVEGDSPRHTYKKVGRYTVTMTASGAAGSDTIVKKDFVVVEPYLSYIPGALAR